MSPQHTYFTRSSEHSRIEGEGMSPHRMYFARFGGDPGLPSSRLPGTRCEELRHQLSPPLERFALVVASVP